MTVIRRSHDATAGDRLSSRGHVYVTLAAAERYAEERHLRIEEARRELTEILLDARIGDEGPPMHVRSRSRTAGLDVSATISREGRLLVVVSVHARDYR